MAKKKASVPTHPLEGTVISPPGRKIQNAATEKTVTVYANNTHVEASNWDIRIRLGLIQSVTSELMTVEDVANVYMSHEHAKAFLAALARTLAQVEALKKQVAGERVAKPS